MKKLITIILTIILFTSCGGKKIVRQSKHVIKGNWTLSQVTHSEEGNYNISLLDDAPQLCFEGSSWQFVPNNNSGAYNFNSTNCNAQLRNFIFTIQEIDKVTGLYDFLLKPTNVKGKSINNNKGFRLKLTQLSDTNMQWQQTVNVNGKPFTINMNFIKQ